MNNKVVAFAAALIAVGATACAIAVLVDQPTYALERAKSNCEVESTVLRDGPGVITEHELDIRTASSVSIWDVVGSRNDQHPTAETSHSYERWLEGTTPRPAARANGTTCHYTINLALEIWFKYH